MTDQKPLPDFAALAPDWRPMDRTTAAAWLASQGAPIEVHDDVAWQRGAGRFWGPALVFDPRDAAARPPKGPSPGYWLPVRPGQANAHVPWTMVDDLPGYGDHRIPEKKVRHRIRRAANLVECVVLDRPDLLLRQGWAIAQQANQRSGQPIPASAEAYGDEVRIRFAGDPQVVLAAVRDGRLLAWMLVQAVGPVVSCTKLFIGDEGFHLDIGVLLYWAALSAGSQLPGVVAAGLGPYYPEKPTLAFTKSRLGGHLVDIPVYAHMVPGLRCYLRRARPVTCIRIGGRHRDEDWGPELRGLPMWGPTG